SGRGADPRHAGDARRERHQDARRFCRARGRRAAGDARLVRKGRRQARARGRERDDHGSARALVRRRSRRRRKSAGGTGVGTTVDIAIAQSAQAETGPGPQRRCIVTGAVVDRRGLLRFVVGPDGEIVPDVAARLPGRGLWLTPRRDIVERATAKRLFARAARRLVTVPPDLADRVEALLARRCGEALGLARRAASAVSGFERVAEAVRRGPAAALLFALDGAETGRRKLGALGRQLPAATVMSAAE